MMSDIECVFESMSGKGSIFISNYTAAQDIALLHSKGIKAILSVARSGRLQHSKEDVPYYLYLPADDHEDYQLYKFFNQTFDFIEAARRHTNVLVHCMAGVSRSVTIVIAYLLKKFKCSLGEVIMMLQRRRSKINPNKGFIEQLKKYAQQEGLKCNFDYEEVPTPKDRSASRGKRPSLGKEKPSNNQQYGLTNPVGRTEKKSAKKKAEKTAVSKEDDGDSLRKTAQTQKETSQTSITKHQQPSANKLDADSPQKRKDYEQFYEGETIHLQKKTSCERGVSPRKEKMTIQEKISKVREKLHQQQEQRRLSSQKKPSSDKNHPPKETKALSSSPSRKPSKHLSEYFSLYSKHHPVTLSLPQQEHEFPPQFCQTEGELCGKEFRMEPRTLYSKIQQKKASFWVAP